MDHRSINTRNLPSPKLSKTTRERTSKKTDKLVESFSMINAYKPNSPRNALETPAKAKHSDRALLAQISDMRGVIRELSHKN